MTYGILSDIHAHDWSTFSKGTVLGVNQRLSITIDEFLRAADAVRRAGGKTLVIAGDIFHVRGSIDPEVLNPFQAAVEEVLDSGITIYAIPGNHDLKSQETNRLSSAIETLGKTYSQNAWIHIINEPRICMRDQVDGPIGSMPPMTGGFPLGFVPWCSTNAILLDALEDLGNEADRLGLARDTVDVFIHAGIDGVLSNMPPHGLTAAKLASFGFRHVFSGHYHHHKDMGDGVFSIGATTHQTWSDVDTKAGFLLVEDDGAVTFNDTHAPKFIDISGRPEEEMELLADGNYVRYRGGSLSPELVNELRQQLVDWGAKGVAISVTKTPVVARTGTAGTSAKAVTLDESVQGFVDGMKDLPPNIELAKVKTGAADILAKSRAVYEET